MMMSRQTSNFINGSLVMRCWRFDGGCELLAKFQYYGEAREWAASRPYSADYFYIAVCDYENECRAFGAKPEVPASGAAS